MGADVLLVGVFVHPSGVGATDGFCGGSVNTGHDGKSVVHGEVCAKSSSPADARIQSPVGGPNQARDKSQQSTAN
jgi:hypothetical protein